MLYRLFTMTRSSDAEAGCCGSAAEQPDLRPIEGDAADEELAQLTKALHRCEEFFARHGLP